MLRLRPYKPCDAEKIVSWLSTEDSFFKWSAGRFGAYPITSEDINHKYIDLNGDCPEADNFYPFTAYDEAGVVGSMIMRFTDTEKKVLRFGFIIVDDTKRGKGYGKEMLRLAMKYAFEILKVEKLTIGVFENNPGAYRCYTSLGFQQVGKESYIIQGEQWDCLELVLTSQAIS